METLNYLNFCHPCLSLDSFGFDKKFTRMRLVDFTECFSTKRFDDILMAEQDSIMEAAELDTLQKDHALLTNKTLLGELLYKLLFKNEPPSIESNG